MHTIRWSIVLLGLAACNGAPVEGPCGTWYPDLDGDGFGDDDSPVEICAPAIPPTDLVTRGGDCNDQDRTVNGGAVEICDGTGIDEDCDGLLDDEDDNIVNGREVWPDLDGDGFGNPDGASSIACSILDGFAANADDCNDDDDATFPGSAELDDTTACMTDRDKDGYGADTTVEGVTPGTDCGDDDPSRSPGAVEHLDDGIDQTCRGQDTWFLADDFEAGVVDPQVVQSVANARVSTEVAYSGKASLRLAGEASLTTRTVGTDSGGACETLRWSFRLWRGSEAPDVGESLSLQIWDGTVFEDLYTVGGMAVRDDVWSVHTGVLTDPAAYRDDFRMRLQTSPMLSGNAFHIDDIEVACTGSDPDADTFGSRVDCAPDDDAHWLDCLTCFDDDGDDYGLACDLGPDCDDEDPTVNPSASDASVDGIDQDCNVTDGPAFIDRFEGRDPQGWEAFPQGVAFDGVYVANGFASLRVSGNAIAEVRTPLDLSGCTEVGWVFLAKRGPEVPAATDMVSLDWSADGTTWTSAFTLTGGTLDDTFIAYRGTLDDPGVLGSAVSFRLASTAKAASDVYIDEFAIGCDPTDGDDDGFWAGLEDCDDTTGTVQPGASDVFGDSIDQDCDGIDG